MINLLVENKCKLNFEEGELKTPLCILLANKFNTI